MAETALVADPWKNANGVVIATSVEDLHNANNKIDKETGLSEKGEPINRLSEQPNQHAMLTGSDMEGKAPPGTSMPAIWLTSTNLRYDYLAVGLPSRWSLRRSLGSISVRGNRHRCVRSSAPTIHVPLFCSHAIFASTAGIH